MSAPRAARGAVVACAVLSIVACGGDDTALGPLGSDAGVDASTVAPPEAGADATTLPKVRQVFQVNPFGNVAAHDNLLWDGDFEWHSSFASQYGWVNAATVVSVGAFSQVRAGPECKSGLKCGFLTQNQRVAALGVSPSGAKVEASLWARVSSGDCYDLGVKLIACDYAGDPDVPVLDDDGPDADGFCHYRVIADERQRASCLFVEARFAEGEAVIDDAILRAAAPGSASTVAAVVPTARDVAVADEARRALRKWLAPGAPRPTAAEEAFRRWSERRRR